ncbi:MAG TPA: IS1634 family transposase [Candidatus Binatia bacterium]
MFLRSIVRRKNGKEHESFSIVENKRVAGGKVVQRHVLYLGEINTNQQAAWRRTIELFEDGELQPKTVALFPEDRAVALSDREIVRIRLKDLQLKRPRQWGACWLATVLYEKLELDRFWAEKLPPNRKGTRWDLVLQTLTTYRLLDPGSEWKLHRQWFEATAMGDLLGADFDLVDSHKLYECLDLLLAHKRSLFDHLTVRWKDLFNAQFDVLLYDLTSTYCESDPVFGESDKRKFGYSRDKRPDCVQVVIALVVTPEGFPLGYEVMPGNTSDRTTLPGFLRQIEEQYGKARRIWIMDRGIPTKKDLQAMRESDPPIHYLVGTPKGSLSRYEKKLLDLPWQRVREGVEVKLLKEEKEFLVLAQSQDRRIKERSMRRRQLKWLCRRLKEIQRMKFAKKTDLAMKLGAAKQQAPSAWRLVQVEIAESAPEPSFTFSLRKKKLRQVRQREGRYLLRSNLTEQPPAQLWHLYIQLTQVEEAFKNLKGDLALRPLFHQREARIEAHIFVAFLAYCLHVTLRRWLRDLAPGLTPRSVLDKFRAIQMIDVHLPTTDGRKVILSRYTQPEKDQQLLLNQLKLQLPEQPPPQITAAGELAN